MEFLCGLPCVPAWTGQALGPGQDALTRRLYYWPYQMTNNFTREMALSRPD
jgi:hypothetical protein